MPVYNHTGLVVSDLARSKHFYREVLGFRPWYDDTTPDEAGAKLLGLEPPLELRLSYLVLGGCVLELISFGAPGALVAWRRRTMNEPGLTHLSVSVDDIEATAARAVELGGQVIEGSSLSGLAMFIRDPDGQLLELLSMRYPQNRPPRPV
jgi:catechol 2,3-dioxygenase-like lactoylglutathione lyase family enzyme